jgi:glucan phosphoethanolaminetransferase (alkaline phosphatase superfamily)
LCTWSEALIFVPEFRQHLLLRNLAAALLMYVIVAMALAALAAILKLPREGGARVVLRCAGKQVLMVGACGVAYLLYYFVFGGITYPFFTKVYDPEATQQILRLGLWFPAIQFGRGVLMTLAVLPVIRTLRLSRGKAALAVGVLIWGAGGLAPLLAPDVHMGPTQRFIHTIEILTQNGSLGITAVLLLRRRPRLLEAEAPAITPGQP